MQEIKMVPLNHGFLWDGANHAGNHKNRMVVTRHVKRRMLEKLVLVLMMLQIVLSFN